MACRASPGSDASLVASMSTPTRPQRRDLYGVVDIHPGLFGQALAGASQPLAVQCRQRMIEDAGCLDAVSSSCRAPHHALETAKLLATIPSAVHGSEELKQEEGLAGLELLILDWPDSTWFANKGMHIPSLVKESNRDGVPIKGKQCNSVAGLCNDENEAECSPLDASRGPRGSVTPSTLGVVLRGARRTRRGALGHRNTASGPERANGRGEGSTASRQLPAAQRRSRPCNWAFCWLEWKWCLARR